MQPSRGVPGAAVTASSDAEPSGRQRHDDRSVSRRDGRHPPPGVTLQLSEFRHRLK